MNHREPRLLPRESRSTCRYIALLLLPVLVPSANTHAIGRSLTPNASRAARPAGSAPYLLNLGSPPLRFEEFVPLPDLSIRPALGGSNPVAAIDTQTANRPDVIPADTGMHLNSPPATHAGPMENSLRPTPASIIPDDTRAPVRPEDFLPYFQIPGAGEVSLIVPVPRAIPPPPPLPPSSATYTQTPR